MCATMYHRTCTGLDPVSSHRHVSDHHGDILHCMLGSLGGREGGRERSREPQFLHRFLLAAVQVLSIITQVPVTITHRFLSLDLEREREKVCKCSWVGEPSSNSCFTPSINSAPFPAASCVLPCGHQFLSSYKPNDNCMRLSHLCWTNCIWGGEVRGGNTGREGGREGGWVGG